jgi:hypothetical protein
MVEEAVYFWCVLSVSDALMESPLIYYEAIFGYPMLHGTIYMVGAGVRVRNTEYLLFPTDRLVSSQSVPSTSTITEENWM